MLCFPVLQAAAEAKLVESIVDGVITATALELERMEAEEESKEAEVDRRTLLHNAEKYALYSQVRSHAHVSPASAARGALLTHTPCPPPSPHARSARAKRNSARATRRASSASGQTRPWSDSAPRWLASRC